MLQLNLKDGQEEKLSVALDLKDKNNIQVELNVINEVLAKGEKGDLLWLFNVKKVVIYN